MTLIDAKVYMDDIHDFHLKFKLAYYGQPRLLEKELHEFRVGFMEEEINEYDKAFKENNLHDQLDALVDINYVVLGTGHLQGIGNYLVIGPSFDDFVGEPRHLPQVFHEYRVALMRGTLQNYVKHYYDQDVYIQFQMLSHLFQLTYDTARMQGFNYREAWNRVHAANMKKVRTERVQDSKRGSTFDVVKPKGWVKPDLSDLVVRNGTT